MKDMLLPANCKKCGQLFDSYDHDSYDGDKSCTDPYEICRDCNDEFWSKFHKLPVYERDRGKPVLTLAHLKLIDEYHKASYFVNR